jgi:hypothetical protein
MRRPTDEDNSIHKGQTCPLIRPLWVKGKDAITVAVAVPGASGFDFHRAVLSLGARANVQGMEPLDTVGPILFRARHEVERV